MKKPLIYLDKCCFNRPYDDQIQARALEKITVMNPLEFVAQEGGNGHEN